jgi:hypothetical protein
MTDETHHDPTKELAALQQALDALTPLDPDGRQRAVTWLAGALGVSSAPAEAPGGFGTPSGSGIPGIDAGPANLGTPRRFMAAKRPTTDVERVTCLAYYLTHARDTPHFKTKELTDLNTEAAGAKISRERIKSSFWLDLFNRDPTRTASGPSVSTRSSMSSDCLRQPRRTTFSSLSSATD